MHRVKLEEALKTKDQIESIRSYVLVLKQRGLKSQEIYDILHVISLELMEEDREEEAEIIEDVMDMVTGWYVCRNIEFD
ncbi:MAG: hypothetical protein COA38_15190 [Fluviicola sp.]|nr:MAG: hypothetical protein COA38_15190 [Fluviicola sp.]